VSFVCFQYSAFLVLVFVTELSTGIAGFIYKGKVTTCTTLLCNTNSGLNSESVLEMLLLHTFLITEIPSKLKNFK